MRKVLWSCMVIGIISITLSILNAVGVASSLKAINEVIRIILPFSGIKVSLAAIYQICPKLQPFIKNFLSPFIGYTISIILFTSGIGVILQKNWGRIFTCIYAISMIVISITALPLTLIHYRKEFIRITREPSFMDGLVWGGALIYILILIGSLLYPIILLIFFSRPKIKEIFSAKK